MARDLAQEQRWRDRIEECRQNGLIVKEWCLQNGLKNTSYSYHYWVKKFKIMEQQEAGDNIFAEVVLLPENKNSTKETGSMKAEFSLSFGDYSIGIPYGFNSITLADTSPQNSSGSYTKNYYDHDKNLIKVETKRDASNTDVVKYLYDNRDRKIQDIKLIDQTDVYNAASLPNLTALLDPNYSGKIQSITGYTYDLLGNLTSTIDPRAYGYLATDTANRNLYTITNGYDLLNRLQTVTKIINGAPVTTKYYYDAVGNKKAVLNERGFYTVYTYDSMNRPLTVTDSETDTSLKTYTEAQIISLSGQINSLKKTATYDYDLAGNRESLIDANRYVTIYVYDYLNRLQTVKAPFDPTKPDSSTNPHNQVLDEKVYDEAVISSRKLMPKGINQAVMTVPDMGPNTLMATPTNC